MNKWDQFNKTFMSVICKCTYNIASDSKTLVNYKTQHRQIRKVVGMGLGGGGWSGLERILFADCLRKIYFFPPPPSLFNSQSLTIIKNATKQ